MDKIGKYEIRAKLGEGATGAVYLAWDSFAQRDVAIKLISAETLNDGEKGRLYRSQLVTEASLAGKLVHPHIVHIYDAVVDDGQGYVVMEYVPGGTLERHCAPAHLLPLERVVEIVFKCTRALDYARRQGVIHRDIKPANILMAGGGDVKISDFGAALMSAADHTQVSGIGSPAYMSPQQVRELPLDHRTDIFSLGVVLYQLLSGHLPFAGGNHYSIVYQITHVDPPPPSHYRPDVSKCMDAVMARAMRKDVDQRYATWDDFSHDLAQAVRNRPLRSRPQEFGDSEKFQTLRRLPFFAEFSDQEIWEIVGFSTWQRVAPGTPLMKDGEPGDHVCVLADGEVEVSKRGHLLGVLGAGECFGEMAITSGDCGTRGEDVLTRGPADVVSIRRDALRQASEACRMHFYLGFLEVLAQRLARANARLAAA